MKRRGLSREVNVYAYKYWIRPIALPPQVWQTGREMLAVWNQLVALWESAFQGLKAGEVVLGEQQTEGLYAGLECELRETVNQSALNWECREFLLDKFRVATWRAIKARRAGGACPVGFPKMRSQLRNIVIPHRYTGGGVTPSTIMRPQPRKSTKRFWIASTPEEAFVDNARAHRRLRYTEGFFGVKGGTLRFKAIVHRPVPQAARVKNVLLVGRLKPPFGWDWSVTLICELPSSPLPIQGTGRYCGLDLGWRKFDAYLRIGMLVDNAGKVIELRLPLSMSNQRTMRFNRWIEEADRPDADRIYETWEELRQANSRADRSFERLRVDLRRRADGMQIPDGARGLLAGLESMRPDGIRHLLLALQEADVAPGLQRLISAWVPLDQSVRRRIQSARQRFIRRRQWLYQNLATWIANSYDIISWEAGLGVKRMAEETGKRPALKRSDRYRQIAAIGEFKRILEHQARKRQALLIDGEAAYSTVTCFVCGARTEPGPALILECPNGHRFDQDENAARWFLARIGDQGRTSSSLRRKPESVVPLVLQIPEHLKTVAA